MPSIANQAGRATQARIDRTHRCPPARTPLLVVDMQHGFLDPGASLEVPKGRAIVPAIRRLKRLLDLERARREQAERSAHTITWHSWNHRRFAAFSAHAASVAVASAQADPRLRRSEWLLDGQFPAAPIADNDRLIVRLVRQGGKVGGMVAEVRVLRG